MHVRGRLSVGTEDKAAHNAVAVQQGQHRTRRCTPCRHISRPHMMMPLIALARHALVVRVNCPRTDSHRRRPLLLCLATCVLCDPKM